MCNKVRPGLVDLTLHCTTPVVPTCQQESLLCKARWTSSCCTGVYTAEVAAALIEKTVNTATEGPSVKVDLRCERCHDTCLAI